MEESILMWNRLEGTLRNEEQFEKAMQFEIRDALWMLTRQWQFGEFDGEDAGTAAFVRFTGQHSPITAIGSPDGPPEVFDFSNGPLERSIEREKFIPDLSDRLEMGIQWESLLAKHLTGANLKSAMDQFRKNSRFRFTSGLPESPDRIHSFQHAGRYGDDSWMQLYSLLASGRAIDGYAVLLELQSGIEASVFLSQSDEKVDQAGREFLEWFDRIYGQHAEKENVWHPQHIEYQPQLAFGGSDGQPRILAKEEYYGDGIDWHGFKQKASWNGGPPPSGKPSGFSSTVIPSGLRFRGMPAARLWEIEDGNVDFGSIQASSTELSKMIFAEFGLVYSNDWLVAPCSLRCGDMCRISGMIVTDIFGKESILDEIEPDDQWGFFQSAAGEREDRWLFVANAGDMIQESRPVEKVTFLRDEMANIVWGVEDMVSNPYGGGRDGESLAKQTAGFVKSLQSKDPGDNIGKPGSAGWSYKAGTLMPENRIPFIPVATEPQQADVLGKRKVVLQRASVPRVADGFLPVRIRPRTSILGYSGKPENERPDPLFIFEEEIPRTGTGISLVWKRVRWFGGQTFTWLARCKKTGSGEINANFRFDIIEK